ncbi:MAG: RNase adapter RapZ [Eubacterium sp.]
MRFVIVTGMSGAGKSTTLKILEDCGYFCVDNLPIKLIEKFADLTFNPNSEISKVAVGVDIRSGQTLNELEAILDNMTKNKQYHNILFMDASDKVIMKRFKETRRAHPLSKDSSIQEGIAKERVELDFLRQRADYIIDTSNILTRELKEQIEKMFVDNMHYKSMFITVLSFGFKYGIPSDSDLVFDVRFLPNPYYVDELKYKTGNDREVRDYVMNSDVSHTFIKQLNDMIKFLIPNYIAEGKNQLVISIGCTGGKHRSVTIANELYEALNTSNKEYGLKIGHRDIIKDNMGIKRRDPNKN